MVSRATEPVRAELQAVIFYLYCNDVDVYRALLQAAGIDVGEMRSPFCSPKGEFRVTDPDGLSILVRHT